MKSTHHPLLVRWTIGDVSANGFEALRLSLWGARKIFGSEAGYVVCVNTLPLTLARKLAGDVPAEVEWRDVTGEVPEFLKQHLDAGMSEGVAWKFAPPRLRADGYELSLDNDCILWKMPEAIRRWLTSAEYACMIAADVRACFGKFSDVCGPEPRNSGIRGLPPGFLLKESLQRLLQEYQVTLTSELDEQGLQVAVLRQTGEPLVVRIDEVSICSPFPPHMLTLGNCGAHFVGLNARQLPWELNHRPAVSYIQEHWERHRPELYRRVGIER
jgi:hypothetical protein